MIGWSSSIWGHTTTRWSYPRPPRFNWSSSRNGSSVYGILRRAPGQTKDGNGSSTFKIGGYHVVSPRDPLLLTPRPPGRGPQRPRARALTLRSTRDPYHRARQGGLRVNKSGSWGVTTWHPFFLTVLNPFSALVCPNSDLLRWIRAKKPKNMTKNSSRPQAGRLKNGPKLTNAVEHPTFGRPPTPP